jgi:hypothetical protein
MKITSTIVLMPAGPGIATEFVQDTVESVAHYLGPNVVLCVLDDTDDGRFRSLDSGGLPLIYLRSADFYSYRDVAGSSFGPLWLKEMRVLDKLVREWRFDCILRLDTDALITGSRPEAVALEQFATDTTIGAVGAFTRRGDGTDKAESTARVGELLRFEASAWRNRRAILAQPARLGTARQLTQLLTRARSNGYVDGYTCTAAALFLRHSLVKRWSDMKLGEHSALRFAGVGDDVLFGLCTFAAGFRLADAAPGLMAINWKGLPMPVEKIDRQGVKIIHPVKTGVDAEQAEIRAFFAAKRRKPILSDPQTVV